MNTEYDHQKILMFIKDYFYAFNAKDPDLLLALWKPDGKMINVGNSGKFLERTPQKFAETLRKWREMPDVRFTCRMQQEPECSIVDGLVASVEAHYQMIMPESTGIHTSYFHLICENGAWKIVSLIDRGFEVTKENKDKEKVTAG